MERKKYVLNPSESIEIHLLSLRLILFYVFHKDVFPCLIFAHLKFTHYLYSLDPLMWNTF